MNFFKKTYPEEIPFTASLFSFRGRKYKARVVDVYDGDSVKVIFKHDGKYKKFKCRLNGIDTPEIRTRNAKEKEMAIKARDELRKLSLDKVVTIICDEFDKYGRILIDFDLPDHNIISVSDYLIKKGYAKKYEGGPKPWFF